MLLIKYNRKYLNYNKFILKLKCNFKNFQEAERMHQKAIKIKTDLLGPLDYEVGLSIGHLASLYNYQMKKYREAEALYLRSIEISKFLLFYSNAIACQTD